MRRQERPSDGPRASSGGTASGARDLLLGSLAALCGASVAVACVVVALRVEVDAPAAAPAAAAPAAAASGPVASAGGQGQGDDAAQDALAALDARDVLDGDGDPGAEAPPPADCPTLEDAAPPWLAAAGLGDSVVPLESFASVPMPKSLERRVAFWQRVWGETPDHVWLVADERRPWVVHAEVDCRDLFQAGEDGAAVDEDKAQDRCWHRIAKERREAVAKIKKNRRLYARKLGSAKLARDAESHMISIEGKRDALVRAQERAAHELGIAEQIFEQVGVPRVFARLGFVESLWRPDAVSRSGAVGTYQFMPATGREHMRVDDVVDERRDSLRAAAAAARYLKSIARQFDGDWALALTAYNQGAARMKRVVKERRTRDIGRIADAGDAGSFGFDGQNYYAQMMAVARITEEMRFEAQPLLERAVLVAEKTEVDELARCLGVDVPTLLKANPALRLRAAPTEEAAKDAPIPERYVLAVPKKSVMMAAQGAAPVKVPPSAP